jgi:hypothetical protein
MESCFPKAKPNKNGNTNTYFKDGASNDPAGFYVSLIEHLNISVNLYVITLQSEDLL